ncbi:MAG: sn-glycerol-3-phosphate ABC transporter ATP-binding protein UgpC [Rhizobiales bacterium]|nr:sn-glycerol-3-phosphate ABC transporter ATP-binding protein UgpC [Hyphomicrobiales bacterium]NRB12909.1 sn-glycerol-3-phosphate ABC transporter ATP-binding protein UgpC [Hyphomicrobiales bacterium]
MAELVLNNIKKSFGDIEVIKGVDLKVSHGEFMVFVGPSGCGKSTMLRMISGLESVTEGSIHIDGADVTHEAPSKRQLAMVFQSYALFPHMTVEQNIGFGLKLAKLPKKEIEEKVAEVARVLKITDLLPRTPRQLSGGQRQRVAIGRSIIRHPKIFLFDEPLSNLDAALRVQMRLEILRLHTRLKTTMVYVTHDQVEAMTLADRIVVFNHGKIEQSGPPIELYNHPANIFVAGFIGAPAMNLIATTLSTDKQGTYIDLDGLRLPFNLKANAVDKMSVTFGIRSEHLEVCTNDSPDFQAQVEIIEDLGSESLLYLQTNFSTEPLTVRVSPENDYRTGQKIGIQVDKSKMHIFDTETGRNMS